MTPDQREQWNRYGCVPRCVVKLSELLNRPITDDELAEAFEDAVPRWKENFGLSNLSEGADFARFAGLSEKEEFFLNCHSLRSYIEDGNELTYALVMTRKWRLDTGELESKSHCRLLIGSQGDLLSLWHPQPDGSVADMNRSLSDLELEEAEFALLYPRTSLNREKSN